MPNNQQYATNIELLTGALASNATDSLRIVSPSTLATSLDEVGGQVQSAVDVAAAIDAIQAALASNAGDTLRVTAPSALPVNSASPLDVSAATVDVQEATPLDVSGATVAVQEDTPLDVSATTVPVDVTDQQGRNLGKARLMDSSGTLLTPAKDSTLSSTLSREVAAWSAGTLPVEQQTPVSLEDTTGAAVNPAQDVDGSSTSATTSTTGKSNAAAVSVPDGRTSVTAAWDVSGAATVTVEVSPDGGATWYQEFTTSPSAAEVATHNFTTGFDDVRVYVDANLNNASIGAKGA